MQTIFRHTKILIALLSVLALFTLQGAPVYAATPEQVTTGHFASAPAGSKYTLTGCDPSIPAGDCTVITKYLNPFIKFLAAVVGVAVVAGIILGGIQYSTSGGEPEKAAAAKNRIRNAIIALLVYLFLFALLRFLIPGQLVRT